MMALLMTSAANTISAMRAVVERSPHPALQVLLEQSPSYYRTLTHKLHWAGSLTAIEPSHN